MECDQGESGIPIASELAGEFPIHSTVTPSCIDSIIWIENLSKGTSEASRQDQRCQKRSISPGPFLYVELELKNVSGKSIFVSEVQQLHIKGPFEMFVLQDAQGRTRRSLFVIREHSPKKVEIKDGCSFYRYYRMDL